MSPAKLNRPKKPRRELADVGEGVAVGVPVGVPLGVPVGVAD